MQSVRARVRQQPADIPLLLICRTLLHPCFREEEFMKYPDSDVMLPMEK